MAFVLATFNVLDLFDASDPGRIDRIASLLRAHAPDVVALQEVGGDEARVTRHEVAEHRFRR